MRLDSAQGLKLEVLTDLTTVSAADESRIAIGIAPGRGKADYKLAVRVAKPKNTDEHIVEKIARRAANEIDVKAMGDISITETPQAVSTRQLLTIGSSISHYRVSAGTLGFFARRLCDGATGFVSCNHVMADQDRGLQGDEIVYPSSRDQGSRPRNVVGYLDGAYSRLRQANVTADCAFAQLADNISYNPGQFDPHPVVVGELFEPFVQKIGRTTGQTLGRITAFDLDYVDIEYYFGAVVFNNQIEIESAQDGPFTRPGDSGSLVFTNDHRPLGLVCASSPIGGASNWGVTYANPISVVLAALGVEFFF